MNHYLEEHFIVLDESLNLFYENFLTYTNKIYCRGRLFYVGTLLL